MRILTAWLEDGYCSNTVANNQLINVIRFVSKSYTHPWKDFANRLHLVLHAYEILLDSLLEKRARKICKVTKHGQLPTSIRQRERSLSFWVGRASKRRTGVSSRRITLQYKHRSNLRLGAFPEASTKILKAKKEKRKNWSSFSSGASTVLQRHLCPPYNIQFKRRTNGRLKRKEQEEFLSPPWRSKWFATVARWGTASSSFLQTLAAGHQP